MLHQISLFWHNLDDVDRIGGGVKDLFKQEELYKDREGQINAIQKTFEDAKKDITKHYSKPNVHAVEIKPIYPDFKVSVISTATNEWVWFYRFNFRKRGCLLEISNGK